jgi:hypothetical protein
VIIQVDNTISDVADFTIASRVLRDYVILDAAGISVVTLDEYEIIYADGLSCAVTEEECARS